MSVGSRMNGEHGCEKTMPGHFDLTSPTLTLPVLCTSPLRLCALSGSPIPLSKALFPIPVSTISSICSSLRMPLLAEQTALTSYDLCQQLVHSACLVPALSVGTAYPEHLAPPASGRSSVQRLEGSPAAWVCGIDRAIVPEELEQKCFCWQWQAGEQPFPPVEPLQESTWECVHQFQSRAAIGSTVDGIVL